MQEQNTISRIMAIPSWASETDLCIGRLLPKYISRWIYSTLADSLWSVVLETRAGFKESSPTYVPTCVVRHSRPPLWIELASAAWIILFRRFLSKHDALAYEFEFEKKRFAQPRDRLVPRNSSSFGGFARNQSTSRTRPLWDRYRREMDNQVKLRHSGYFPSLLRRRNYFSDDLAKCW